MSAIRIAAGVGWSVGRTNLTLTDGRGHVRTMGYPEAAVWDLLCRGYAFEKVVAMMTHIAALDHLDAEQLVRGSMDSWRQDGLLHIF